MIGHPQGKLSRGGISLLTFLLLQTRKWVAIKAKSPNQKKQQPQNNGGSAALDPPYKNMTPQDTSIGYDQNNNFYFLTLLLINIFKTYTEH